VRRERQKGAERISLERLFREAEEKDSRLKSSKKLLRISQTEERSISNLGHDLDSRSRERGFRRARGEGLPRRGDPSREQQLQGEVHGRGFSPLLGSEEGGEAQSQRELYRKDGALCMRVREVVY